MISRRSRIGLGTVQWGIEYGVSNRHGRTPGHEVGCILASARAIGIQIVDTAALYGEAEVALGEHNLANLRIVTKTPRYSRSPITATDSEDLKKTLERSLTRLRLPSVYGLLAHHADDLLAPGGDRLIDALMSLRTTGKVTNIGVSVYDGAQIDAVLERFTPDLVQVPLNVFDQRLIKDGVLKRISSLGIEIHVRSAFLQGLLLMHPDSLPPYFDPWREQLRAWHNFCAKNKVLPQQAALAFVCDQPEINCCLVGVENSFQLNQSMEGLDEVPTFDFSEFSCDDLRLVNPVSWRLS